MIMQATRALMLRDLRLLWRRRGDAFQPALFALLVVVLFAQHQGLRRGPHHCARSSWARSNVSMRVRTGGAA